MVAEHVNAKRMTIIVRFYIEHKQTILNSWYDKTMDISREERAFASSPEMGLRIQGRRNIGRAVKS